MPVHCAAFGCVHRRSVHTRREGITFHRFPKAGDQRRKWEVALKREGFAASDDTMLCSKHFKPEHFDRTGQTVRIRLGVVPSIFAFPAHLLKTHAVTIKKEHDYEVSVDRNFGMENDEQQEQPIATEMVKVEPLEEEESFPHKHLEQTHAVTIKKEHDYEVSVDRNFGLENDEQQKQPIATEMVKLEPLEEEESFPHKHLEQTHAVTIKKEHDYEVSVDRNFGLENDEQQKQPIATEMVKLEPLEEEESFPHKHLEQEASAYPPLPAMPFPSVLSIEAASYNMPPRLGMQLLLIADPPGFSVLWDVEEEEDPAPPPMKSYSVYMAAEKEEGSGVFAAWKTLGVVKAVALPMCVMVSKVRPGFHACLSVVGKDTFGRYGPYSKVMPVIVPDQY